MAHQVDEPTLEAARRELLEETGYTSDHFIEVGSLCADPASYTNLTYTYLALDAFKAPEQNLDEAEEIAVFLLPFNEAVHMAQRGDFVQALHVSAIFFALAYLDRIA